ncbi:MAG: replication-relaxation family protein, partial [Chloroflexota bacterium]
LLFPDNTVRCLFVEMDMGTETNARVARKMRAYDSYRRRGFEERFDYKIVDVLVVTSGQRRMENLIRVTRKEIEGRLGLFATLEALHPDKVLAGWQDCHGRTVDLRET